VEDKHDREKCAVRTARTHAVDIGEVLENDVVPIAVKSLLF
jgi:hypothetical protein